VSNVGACTQAAKAAGVKIITWTLERSGPLGGGGGWYYGTSLSLTNNDGDKFELLHVLHKDVGVVGVFSDWPATTTFYANCLIQQTKNKCTNNPLYPATLGPRPRYLIDDMADSDLKNMLNECIQDNTVLYTPHDFSIGHRGAAMMFPEHTEESYIAAMEMGAGIVECDVAVTKDGELVCRHDQCDLHTSTNILVTDLASKCSIPFVAASTPTIWTEIAYPQGGAKHLVMTSPKVTSSAFPHGEVTLEYHTMYRTGDVFGSPAPPLLWTRSAQAVCDCCVS